MRHTSGVALIEVLISVAILTFGLGAGLRALSTCARTQTRIETRETARRLAEQQLTELTVARGWSQGDLGGKFGPPFGTYSWSAQTHAAGGDSPFTIVDFKLWHGEGSSHRLLYTTRTLVQ